MARAICRCGQELPSPEAGSERVVCPKCGARVRIRKAATAPPADPGASSDGFIRFFCPCGRRLKVPSNDPPANGKCPDCGRIVPVPRGGVAPPPGHPDAPTEELTAADLAELDAWSNRIANGTPSSTADFAIRPESAAPRRVEAGLRVCPRCGRPIHMGSTACRACGTVVPKR
jgi:hypothetical protein